MIWYFDWLEGSGVVKNEVTICLEALYHKDLIDEGRGQLPMGTSLIIYCYLIVPIIYKISRSGHFEHSSLWCADKEQLY